MQLKRLQAEAELDKAALEEIIEGNTGDGLAAATGQPAKGLQSISGLVSTQGAR